MKYSSPDKEMLLLLLLLGFFSQNDGLELRVGHMIDDENIDPRVMKVCLDIAAKQIRQDINETYDIKFYYTKAGNADPYNHPMYGGNVQIAINEFDRLYFDEKVHVTMAPSKTQELESVGLSAAARDHLLLSANAAGSGFTLRTYYSTLARFQLDTYQMAEVLAKVIKFYGWKRVAVIGNRGEADFTRLFYYYALYGARLKVSRTTVYGELEDKHFDAVRSQARIVVVSFGESIEENMEFLIKAHARNMTGPDYVYLMPWFRPSFKEMPWETNSEHGEMLRKLFSKILVFFPSGFHEDKFNGWIGALSSVTEPLYNITAEDLKAKAITLGTLRDALYMYALALNECSGTNSSCNSNSGRDMIDALTETHITDGASGTVRFNVKGNRLSDYNIQTFVDGKWVVNKVSKVHVHGPMTLEHLVDVDWMTDDGDIPADTPDCGFKGEKCVEDNTGQIIAGIIGIALVVCCCMAIFVRQRNKKFEAEILAKVWQISPEELQSVTQPAGFSLRSMRSLRSGGDVTSQASDAKALAETQALWKGTIVMVYKMTANSKVEITKRNELLLLKEMKELQCENLNLFIGVCLSDDAVKVVWNYCQKESLDILVHNDEINLDAFFCSSILQDIIRGLCYLHSSKKVGCHGQLNIRNCMVDSRWTVRLSGFGISGVLHSMVQNGNAVLPGYMQLSQTELSELAPELLREYNTELGTLSVQGNIQTDVYAFGMIMYQVLFRESAFASVALDRDHIIDQLKDPAPETGSKPLRPHLPDKHPFKKNLIQLMNDCWNEHPNQRPSVLNIRPMISGSLPAKGNLVDHAIGIMESYAKNLEGMVEARTTELIEERQRADELLNKMLPKPIAEQLKRGIHVPPETFNLVTIMFTDVVGFTNICSKSTPIEVVAMMNGFYSLFDDTCEQFDVYKVETIGDAYMVASGLPVRNGDRHVIEIASLAIEFRKLIKRHRVEHLPGQHLKIRFGIHSGPVAAGVVGISMPHYCLFGDTVNTAARMESHGETMKIHVTEDTKILLEPFKEEHGLLLEQRGIVDVKGKGALTTFWLEGTQEYCVRVRRTSTMYTDS